MDEGICQKLQHREPEATVVFEFFMERLQKSEHARTALLAERRRSKLLHPTPHICTHTQVLHPHTQELYMPQHRQEWLWANSQGNVARGKDQKEMISYAHHTENQRGLPHALIRQCSSLHPQPIVWSFMTSTPFLISCWAQLRKE